MFYDESFVTMTDGSLKERVAELVTFNDSILGDMLNDKEIIRMINKEISEADNIRFQTILYPTFEGSKIIGGIPLVPMFPYRAFTDQNVEALKVEDKAALIASIAFSVSGIPYNEEGITLTKDIIDHHRQADLLALLGHYLFPLMAEYVEKKINAPQGSLFFFMTPDCIALACYPEIHNLF